MTILVPTSAVPTNPSTEHIEDAFGSIARHPLLAASRKIVICDAIPSAVEQERYADAKWRAAWSRADAYAEYRRRLADVCERQQPPFVNARCLELAHFSHVSGGLRAALDHVSTPAVMVHQHDLELRDPESLPVDGILSALARCPNVRYVVLNRWRNDHFNSRTWFRLRPELRPDCGDAGALPRLTAVQGFTDQTHLAATSHYREVLLPRCRVPDAPEHQLHPLARATDHAEFGGWALGGPGEGPFISARHSTRLARLRRRLDTEPET